MALLCVLSSSISTSSATQMWINLTIKFDIDDQCGNRSLNNGFTVCLIIINLKLIVFSYRIDKDISNDIPVCTLSPTCSSDIFTNFPFPRLTFASDGKHVTAGVAPSPHPQQLWKFKGSPGQGLHTHIRFPIVCGENILERVQVVQFRINRKKSEQINFNDVAACSFIRKKIQKVNFPRSKLKHWLKFTYNSSSSPSIAINKFFSLD